MSITFASECEFRVTDDGHGLHFYDVGSGPTQVVLLHGLFGSPSNWLQIMHDLSDHYRFLALQLPIDFRADRRHAAVKSLDQITDHVVRFFDLMDLERAVLCGNSIGGQVSLDLHARHPERIEKLILSGSAGLFERSLAGGRPPRLCRNYIREQACGIFHDPVHVDEELIDAIYAMLSDRKYRRFLLRVAKASRDRCMMGELAKVKVPTMIIWGSDDTITPPFVAEEFCQNIDQAELVYIDQCGHAPPIERPDKFAEVLHAFLSDQSSDRYRGPSKPR
jgi:pimeloyl-ACP methyl ester carboxylesterase